MSTASATEFRLRIVATADPAWYDVVGSTSVAEAASTFQMPLTDVELENFVLKIGQRGRGVRRVESPETELTKRVGSALFAALFQGDVLDLYRSSIGAARDARQPLRITLALTDAPGLLQVPWEYLYDHPSFLAISTWTPVVRYLELPTSRSPLRSQLPLRILSVVSAPSGVEPIDAAAEKAKLTISLQPLIDAGAVAIDWLENATLLELTRQLRRAEYQVFHYIGHGGYDAATDDGVLVFEDDDGRAQRVRGDELGHVLQDEVGLRLVVLNSCEGARTSLSDPFSGVATSLVERDMPAVIGMQFEISDRAAIVFASEFYSSIANGMPVDSAMAEARKGIYADQNPIEWGTPVLFMRVADGQLFDIQAHPPVKPASRDALLETAAHAGLQVEMTRLAQAQSAGAPPRRDSHAPLLRTESEAAAPQRTPAETVSDRPLHVPTSRTTTPSAIPRESERNRRNAGALLAILVLLVASAGAWAFLPGIIESWSQSNGTASENDGSPSDRGTSGPVTRFVPNVYRQPREEAVAALRAAGFTNLRVENVCSRSVRTSGLVRQVMEDVGLPDGAGSDPELELVGEHGQSRMVPTSTRLHVKITTGELCP